MFSVEFKKSALKYLVKLTKKDATQIRDAINDVAADPYNTTRDVVKLENRDGYRLRVRGYRVIYSLDDAVVILTVEKVGPRGDAYKGSR